MKNKTGMIIGNIFFILCWCMCMFFIWLNCVHLMDVDIIYTSNPLTYCNYNFYQVGLLPGIALIIFSVLFLASIYHEDIKKVVDRLEKT